MWIETRILDQRRSDREDGTAVFADAAVSVTGLRRGDPEHTPVGPDVLLAARATELQEKRFLEYIEQFLLLRVGVVSNLFVFLKVPDLDRDVPALQCLVDIAPIEVFRGQRRAIAGIDIA